MFAIGIFLASVVFLHLLKNIQCIFYCDLAVKSNMHFFLLSEKYTLSLWVFINFFMLEILPFFFFFFYISKHEVNNLNIKEIGHNKHLMCICQEISHNIYLLNIDVRVYKPH